MVVLLFCCVRVSVLVDAKSIPGMNPSFAVPHVW
uniref:Uncharacterized protein n=1 Tax=Arundo donax TaxID=35708 RepID=A0A0A8Y0K4_ARUDO